MIKWFREQTTSVKAMLIIIVLLVIGIIVRWDFVSSGVKEAFTFKKPAATEQTHLNETGDENTDNQRP